MGEEGRRELRGIYVLGLQAERMYSARAPTEIESVTVRVSESCWSKKRKQNCNARGVKKHPFS